MQPQLDKENESKQAEPGLLLQVLPAVAGVRNNANPKAYPSLAILIANARYFQENRKILAWTLIYFA